MPIWVAGRVTWLFARLYNDVEPRAEWLELAAHGLAFLEKYGFDRDGTLSSTLKGNMWKGPFHLPRMQLNCWKLLETMNGAPG